MTNYSRSVLLSNGLHHLKNLPVKFGFSPIDTPANIAKKLPPQVPSQTTSHPDFQLLAQTAHVCFHGRNRVHTRLCSKDRTQRPTRRNRGLPSLDHSAALCRQRNTLYSATLLYTYISRFSVNPHHQQREKIRQSYRHGSISSRFSTSPTNGPRSLSRAKVGTHSALLKGSHTRAHTAKQGAFQLGVLSLPSERSARSQTSPGRVSERCTLPLLGLGRGCSRRTQRACGAATRSCVSLFRRRRGPAGLRSFVAAARSA